MTRYEPEQSLSSPQLLAICRRRSCLANKSRYFATFSAIALKMEVPLKDCISYKAQIDSQKRWPRQL